MSQDLKLLLTLNDFAQILARKTFAFADGSLPKKLRAAKNAERIAKENPGFRCVRGWLIIGTCIFVKHSVIADETGELFEITPDADELPFASHPPMVGRYDKMPDELNLLDQAADFRLANLD